jgi:hypothetical protein
LQRGPIGVVQLHQADGNQRVVVADAITLLAFELRNAILAHLRGQVIP